jgi:chromosomal replication initiator protein
MNKNNSAMDDGIHVGLWDRCLQIIRDNVTESTFNTWFVPIVPLKYADKTLLIQVPSQFFYEFIEEKFVDLLEPTIYKVVGEDTKLMYQVMIDSSTHTTVDLGSQAVPVNTHDKNRALNIPPVIEVQELDSHLNPYHTFENFIEGDSNILSRSVAETIAKSPAKTAFNPLFLYGASGVGKTHLVNAIGVRIKELYPEKRVLYVSAHLFQVQYTDSVRHNNTNDFINFYQTIDVLIIDDIQELAGVIKTQNTFFHIFNHLHQNGKQLILASDRPPRSLQGVEERLLTRFRFGMVAELEKPTVSLRKSILRDKVHRDGLSFPDDVIDYIAENVTESVRDLEGIIVSIMAHSTIYNRDIDLNLAQQIIQKVGRVEDRVITIEQIIAIVCAHYGIEPVAIHTKSRKREIVEARQMAMYLAKMNTDLSTSKIGKFIGDKDHATVLHACKIVKQQYEVDKNFRSDLETLERNLKCR